MLSIVIFFLMSLQPTSHVQEFLSVEACFESYTEGSYCFVDTSGETYVFCDMERGVMEKYDLTDGNHLGRMFIVVYTIEITVYKDGNEEDDEEENEEDDEKENKDGETEYRDYIIVDLELIG